MTHYPETDYPKTETVTSPATADQIDSGAAVLRCRECPVWGRSYYESTGRSLCFCCFKGTSIVNPDDFCLFGIQDYETYWREKMSEGKWRQREQKHIPGQEWWLLEEPYPPRGEH